MANRIKAINAYMPDIQLGKRADLGDLVSFIARSTNLNEGSIRQVLTELRDAVVFFNLRGQPVQLEGLGTYTPTIDLDGVINVGHRADNYIKDHLNVSGEFKGEIERRENVPSTGSGQAARAAMTWLRSGTLTTPTTRWRKPLHGECVAPVNMAPRTLLANFPYSNRLVSL